MTRNEEITRATARLVGHDVSGLRWNEEAMGLASNDGADVFAPMADPCDAFMVEATLLMNVNYRFNGKEVNIAVNSSKKEAANGALYVTTVPLDDSDRLLVERMRAIVEFAWMIAVCQKVA